MGFQAEMTDMVEGIIYRCSQRRISMCSYECKAEMSTWEKLLGPYQSLHGSIPHHTHRSPINMSVPNESRICKLTHDTSLTHKHTGKEWFSFITLLTQTFCPEHILDNIWTICARPGMLFRIMTVSVFVVLIK